MLEVLNEPVDVEIMNEDTIVTLLVQECVEQMVEAQTNVPPVCPSVTAHDHDRFFASVKPRSKLLNKLIEWDAFEFACGIPDDAIRAGEQTAMINSHLEAKLGIIVLLTRRGHLTPGSVEQRQGWIGNLLH